MKDLDQPTLLAIFARDLLLDDITYDRYRLVHLMLDSARELERQRKMISNLKYWLLTAAITIGFFIANEVLR